MKKRKADISSPFIGNGKLTPYSKKSDSWIWNQVDTGKVDPGIKVVKDKDFTRLSKLKRIASNIVASSESIVISRFAKQRSSTSTNNYRFSLKWTLHGDLDGATIEEIEMASNLLTSRVEADLGSLKDDFTTSLEKQSNISVDFEKKRLFADALVSFDVNIMTDDSKIKEAIVKLGFDFGASVEEGK